MPNRIPIEAAKELSKKYNLEQVILCAWDGKLTHVTTYGTTVEACDQAAMGGNRVKDALNWPQSLHTVPSRVKLLLGLCQKLRGRLSVVSPLVEDRVLIQEVDQVLAKAKVK